MAATTRCDAHIPALAIIPLFLFSIPPVFDLVVRNSCFLDEALRYCFIRIL